MNQEQFIQALLDKGITLTSKQLEQFENYYQTLVESKNEFNSHYSKRRCLFETFL